MEAKSVKQDQVFCLYTAHTEKQTLHNDKWEESTQSTPIQQSPKTDSRHIVSDGKLDYVMRSDILQNIIVRSGQSTTKGETKTRLGQISCRLERLGIDT